MRLRSRPCETPSIPTLPFPPISNPKTSSPREVARASLTLSIVDRAYLRLAVARAGHRPLNLGTSGSGAAKRGVPARPDTVRGPDLATGRGFGQRSPAGGAGIRTALRRLSWSERARERSGRTIPVPATSRLFIGPVQVQVHRCRRAAYRRGSPANGPRRPGCQRDAVLRRRTLDRGVGRR